MNETIRQTCWKAGKKLRNDFLLEKSAPRYYRYARKNIPCKCPKCHCPARSSHKYSFVYLDELSQLMYFDVPKAASTTIRHAFYQNRQSASMTNPRNSLESYFKFTFVRNPWDRMVSNWKMFTTSPKRILQLKSMTNKDLSRFDHFIDFAIHNANHHWQPQVLFIPENLDFIGKFEDFDEDMNKLLEILGREPLKFDKRNTTKRTKYQDYYTPSLIDLVGNFYQSDIEKFGYQF